MCANRPPLDYVAHCSDPSLESLMLSRMSASANLRKQFLEALNDLIDIEADARLAKMMLDWRRGGQATRESSTDQSKSSSSAGSGEQSDQHTRDAPLAIAIGSRDVVASASGSDPAIQEAACAAQTVQTGNIQAAAGATERGFRREGEAAPPDPATCARSRSQPDATPGAERRAQRNSELDRRCFLPRARLIRLRMLSPDASRLALDDSPARVRWHPSSAYALGAIRHTSREFVA